MEAISVFYVSASQLVGCWSVVVVIKLHVLWQYYYIFVYFLMIPQICPEAKDYCLNDNEVEARHYKCKKINKNKKVIDITTLQLINHSA